MEHVRTGATLRAIEERAVASGVSVAVARQAREVTARRFVSDAAGRARLEAYFWGVVRRRALRGGAPAVRERLCLVSLVDELAAAGHTRDRILDEARRTFGGAIDAAEIESLVAVCAA